MEDSDVSYIQWNSVCWDSVDIFLKLKDWKITDYSHAWNPSMITSAAASLLADLIIWVKIQDVLLWDKSLFDNEWFIVSERRKRAVVTALLAVRNALHNYMKDWVIDNYEDLYVS